MRNEIILGEGESWVGWSYGVIGLFISMYKNFFKAFFWDDSKITHLINLSFI